MALSDLASLGLAVILGVAAMGKLMSIGRFQSTLVATYGLSGAVAIWVARALPFVELLAALLLIWPPERSIGLGVAAATLGALSLGATLAWATGARGDCGCWGVLSQQELGLATILRNGVLLSFALLGLVLRLAGR